MADNDIEVRVGAEGGDLDRDMQKAAKAVSDATGRMRDHLGRFTAASKQASETAGKGFQEAAEQVANSGNKITGSLDGVLGRFKQLAAGYIGFQTIQSFLNTADAVAMMDARLKLATKSQEDFKAAQQGVYQISQANNIGLEETTTLFTKLNGPVQRLGGTVRETTGIVDAFATSLRISGANTVEASAATLQFAQAMASGKLSGDEFRSIAETSPRFMKAMADGMGQPIEKLKQLGSEGKLTADVVGNALLASLNQLKTEAANLPDTVGGAFTRMKNEVMGTVDTFNQLSSTTDTVASAIGFGADMIGRFNGLLKTLKGEASSTGSEFTFMDGVLFALGKTFETIVLIVSDVIYIFRSMGRELGGIAAQVAAVLQGDFAGAAAIREAMLKDAKDARDELDKFQQGISTMTDKAIQARQALRSLEGSGAEGSDARINRMGNAGKLKPGVKDDDDKDGKKFMAALEAKLQLLKDHNTKRANEEGRFYKMSAQEEMAFWEKSLSTAAKGSQARILVERKIIGLKQQINREEFDNRSNTEAAMREVAQAGAKQRLEIAQREQLAIEQFYGRDSSQYRMATMRKLMAEQQLAQEVRALREVRLQAGQAAAEAEIDEAEANAQFLLQHEQITNEQLLAMQAEFETRRTALRVAAMKERLATVDPEKDPVQYAALLAQVQQLEIEHQRKMGEIRRAAATEQTKYSTQFYKGMESGFASVLQRFAQGTMTIRSLFVSMGKVILDSMIGVFAQIAAKWMAMQVMKMLGLKQEGAASIATRAAEAGAGGVASMAAAPFPLNMTAPAFGAAMAAAASSFAALMAAPGFAVGSWNVPTDMITKVHKGETIMPSEFAERFREGEMGGRGGDMVVELKGAQMGNFFMLHRDELVRALKSVKRDFAF